MGKILIPALLAVLGIAVLSMFSQLERELEHQLQKASAFSVHVAEYVSEEQAASMIQRTALDEFMWAERYGDDAVWHASQIFISAWPPQGESVPVYAASIVDEEIYVDPQRVPSIRLLSVRPPRQSMSEVKLAGKRVPVESAVMPAWLNQVANADQLVLLPDAMARSLKLRGYMHRMLVELESVDEVEHFVAEITAYTKADNRQVKVVSALSILRDLERITAIQRSVRTMIVIGCGVILAFTLGSIAWLEYRQDAYVLALLRSFGTPVFVLFVHTLMENLLLVILGIGLAMGTWKLLCEWLLGRLSTIGFEVSGVPELLLSDMWLIGSAALVGVLLAMIPVAVGLRKPPGLLLQ